MRLKTYLQAIKLDLIRKDGKMQITPVTSAAINGKVGWTRQYTEVIK